MKLLPGGSPVSHRVSGRAAGPQMDGTLVNLGAFDPLREVRGAGLIFGRRSLAGSLIGRVARRRRWSTTAPGATSSLRSN